MQSFTDWTRDESCKWIYLIVSCHPLFVGNTRLLLVEMQCPPPIPYASSPFDVIDRCCSLFIWSGFNNMKPIARSGACCCLYGPLSASCPLTEKWEREREREKVDESEMCSILWEELNGNKATSEINTEQRAASLQDGARIPNKKLLLSCFSLLSPPHQTFTLCLFLKLLV